MASYDLSSVNLSLDDFRLGRRSRASTRTTSDIAEPPEAGARAPQAIQRGVEPALWLLAGSAATTAAVVVGYVAGRRLSPSRAIRDALVPTTMPQSTMPNEVTAELSPEVRCEAIVVPGASRNDTASRIEGRRVVAFVDDESVSAFATYPPLPNSVSGRQRQASVVPERFDLSEVRAAFDGPKVWAGMSVALLSASFVTAYLNASLLIVVALTAVGMASTARMLRVLAAERVRLGRVGLSRYSSTAR